METQTNHNSGYCSDDSAYYLQDVPLEIEFVTMKHVQVAEMTVSSEKINNNISCAGEEEKKSKKNRHSYGTRKRDQEDTGSELVAEMEVARIMKIKHVADEVTSSKKIKKKTRSKPTCIRNPNQENPRNRNFPEGSAVLFVEKEVTWTDANDHHHRFSVSCNKVECDDFITKEEAEILVQEGLRAKLIDPANREYDITLRLRETGKRCHCYTIPKPWNLIRKENGIQKGMVIQFWASRSQCSQLCFNLVILK